MNNLVVNLSADVRRFTQGMEQVQRETQRLKAFGRALTQEFLTPLEQAQKRANEVKQAAARGFVHPQIAIRAMQDIKARVAQQQAAAQQPNAVQQARELQRSNVAAAAAQEAKRLAAVGQQIAREFGDPADLVRQKMADVSKAIAAGAVDFQTGQKAIRHYTEELNRMAVAARAAAAPRQLAPLSTLSGSADEFARLTAFGRQLENNFARPIDVTRRRIADLYRAISIGAVTNLDIAERALAHYRAELRQLEAAHARAGRSFGFLSAGGGRGAFAVQQFGFAIEDATTVLSMPGMGLSDAVRSAGNNISALVGAFNPVAGLIAGLGTSGLSLLLRFFERSKDGARELKEELEQVAEAIRKMADTQKFLAEVGTLKDRRQVQSQVESKLTELAGLRGAQSALEKKRQANAQELARIPVPQAGIFDFGGAHDFNKERRDQLNAENKEIEKRLAQNRVEQERLRGGLFGGGEIAALQGRNAQLADRAKQQQQFAEFFGFVGAANRGLDRLGNQAAALGGFLSRAKVPNGMFGMAADFGNQLLQQREERERQAQRIKDQTRTPLEGLQDRLRDSALFFRQGRINADTYQRVLDNVAAEREGMAGHAPGLAGAALRGSQEALSIINRSAQWGGPGDAQERIARGIERMAKQNDEVLRLLTEGNKLVKDGKPKAARIVP